MADIKISDMMRMQMNLWEQHKDTWSPMEAKFGRNFILWMMEEMGECIAIIKKKGDSAIMREASVREAFVEEMSDVLMYYFDTLLRYGVTPEEISNAYVAKHNKNMGRDFKGNTITNTQNEHHPLHAGFPAMGGPKEHVPRFPFGRTVPGTHKSRKRTHRTGSGAHISPFCRSN